MEPEPDPVPPVRRSGAGIWRIERTLEAGLFAGRWLLAPVYVGLLVALGMVTVKFAQELVHSVLGLLSMKDKDLVMFVLNLVDLALLGNLVLMVAYVDYENFVPKLHAEAHEDCPGWMTLVDFSSLKLKLFSSIVAISAIHLLRTFLDLRETPKEDVAWQLAIHLGFVVSGVLLAWMDRLSASAHSAGRPE